MRLKKNRKVSKGYRLRPETHKKINRIQKILKTDYDDTLNLLCTVFLKEIISVNNKFHKR
jgi:hypothetical protein